MRRSAPAAAFVLGLTGAVPALGQPIPVGVPQGPPSPTTPAPAPESAPAPAPATPAPAAPTPAPAEAPPGFYVEGTPGASTGSEPAPEAAPPPIFEPPAPGIAVFEPVPPPVPHHVAPRSSLWLGARVGWFVPFGSAYARAVAVDEGGGAVLVSVPWRDFVSSGPSFELDAGARLSRNYNVFALWERAELGSGDAEASLHGGQKGGDTDLFALGLRATSNPDGLGFLTEISIGYRQGRATWNDGTEYRMTGGVLEGRIAIGADVRLSPMFSLAPMLGVGVGSFDRFRVVVPGGAGYDRIGPNDAPGGHGWVTLALGGHADLLGAN